MGGEACIDVLGPVRATVDGRRVDVGGPKPKLVLARLAMAAPHAVTVDGLIESLWGGRPPATARKTVHGYICGLRAALGADAVVTAGPAYRLGLHASAVDVHRFRTLVTRAAATGGEDAWETLSAATELWRGPPLTGVGDGVFVAHEARRLAELYVDAVERQMEIGLELGRDDVLVPVLEELVERHPLRERLWTTLMTALYRSGRQAEALAAYRRLRALLADELGIEPSEVAADLHSRMLAHDPGLARRAHVDRRGNLPHRLTSFVGRELVTRQLEDVLRRSRLVTLVGAGGVGKSRLAEQVAARVASRFRHGVWLAELAPLRRGEPVPHAVAVALGIQQRHGLGIAETVVAYCRDKTLLLVVDNCEHLLDDVGSLVERIVSTGEGVAVLATSREALGIAGEQVWPVAPLETADAGALFAERAAAVRPSFRLERATVPVVDEICARLDRLPLAIELAAARIRTMTAAELAAHLDERFRLLTTRHRSAPDRHQSLRSAIDWSHDLLDGAEQELLAGLSVFSGGFDVTAAREVCGPDRDGQAVADLLADLVDRSMVVVETVGGATRFRLLETIRAYAGERLEARRTAEDLRRRHAAYYAGLAERARPGLSGPEEGSWAQRLATDFDNLRSAVEWATTAGDVDLAFRLVAYLPDFTYWRIGYESATWAERAMELAEADVHPLFAGVCAGAARGAWMVADYRRAECLARRSAAVAATAAAGSGGRVPAAGPRTCYPGDVLADVALYDGRVEEALDHYRHEATQARARAEPLRLAWAQYYVAVCQCVRRTPEAGIPAAEESLALATAAGNPTAVAMALYALGLALKKSDPDRALALFEQSVAASVRARNRWVEGIALMEAAATRAVHGQVDAAAAALQHALTQWERTGDRTQQWLNLRYIARLLVRIGDAEAAVVLHHCLLRAAKRSPLDEHGLAELAARLRHGRFAAAAARGRAMSDGDAVAYAGRRLEACTMSAGSGHRAGSLLGYPVDSGPPGCHRTSPPGFATRPRMNSRSESRLR
ncbi:MAG: BTAD domain-containing putative transcriptional regulator [Pseudonocardia sp.]